MMQVWPVIASRHRPEALRGQINLLLPQLRGEERIIVVVDGDADTLALLRGVYGADERLVIVPVAENVGVYRARRVGNAQVPSDAVVCELDDEDHAEADLLAELRTAFAEPGVLVAYCDVWHTDSGRTVKPQLRKKDDGRFCEHGQLGWGMKAYRKWAYDCVGGYPLQYEAGGDFALMCALEAFAGGNGAVVHIRRPLVTVIESRGITSENKDAQQKAVEKIAGLALNDRLKLPFQFVKVIGGPEPKAETEFLVPTGAGGLPEPRPARPAGERHKPHVCLVTDFVGMGRGGGEKSMLGLLRKAAEAGFKVSALYVRDAGTEPYKADWITLHKVPDMISVRGKSGEVTDAFRRAVRQIDPDLLVTEGGTAANIVKAAKALGYPTLTLVQFWRGMVKTTPEGMDAINEDRLTADVLDLKGCDNIRRSAVLVSNSEYSGAVAEKALGRKVDAVVYPPIDPEAVVCKDAPPVAERPYILSTSVQSLKGCPTFLELARRNQDKQFMLCGGDYQISKEGYVDEAEALPNLTVIRDWQADMRPIYAQTRCVFIGTQTCESFSRVAAEARANGIPLLVSDAGNLVNMAADGHGVVVPRKAEIAEWQAGLDKALALRPEADLSKCQDHSTRFNAALKRGRNLSEVVFLAPSALGIQQGIRHFARVMGTRMADWATPASDLAGQELVILPGIYAKDVVAAVQSKIAVWWCSHFAQMDTNRHEVSVLLTAIEGLRKHSHAYLLLTSQPDVQTWQTALGEERVKWLPNAMTLPEIEPEFSAKWLGRNVFIPGHYHPRKNAYTALAACTGLDVDVHVTKLADKMEGFRDLAAALGIRLHVHACDTNEDVRGVARRCQAALCLSEAETYCFAAAECVVEGTPVVSWCGVPVLRYSPAGAWLADPTDVGLARQRLAGLLKHPDEVWRVQYAVARANIAKMNQAARQTLLEVLEG